MNQSEPRLEQVVFDSIGVEEWNGLALASANLFATREFLETWWRHFGVGELCCAVWRGADNSLAGAIPLYRSRRGGLTFARFLGHGPGDLLGPICAPGAEATAVHALASVLARTPCDVFLAEHLPSEVWRDRIEGRVVREESSPFLAATDWDAYFASRSTHFRKKIRWQARRLASDGEVTYRLSTDATLDADLDMLFRLHKARWAGDTDFARHSQFHREFASHALARGWLRLWQLELDGSTVATLHSMRFAGREWHLQSGRDPRVTAVSPGLLLLVHAIKEALDEGVREYLLLRGGEDYKSRFATNDSTLLSIVRGISGRGSAAVRLGVAVDRAGPLGRPMRRVLGAG